jgi:hypothetical protein
MNQRRLKTMAKRQHLGEFVADYRDQNGKFHPIATERFFAAQEEAEEFAELGGSAWRITRVGNTSRGDTVVSVGSLVDRGPSPLSASIRSAYGLAPMTLTLWPSSRYSPVRNPLLPVCPTEPDWNDVEGCGGQNVELLRHVDGADGYWLCNDCGLHFDPDDLNGRPRQGRFAVPALRA